MHDQELTMTQPQPGLFFRIIERMAHAPASYEAMAPRLSDIPDQDDRDDDDDRTLRRDEGYYWGWCMTGHW